MPHNHPFESHSCHFERSEKSILNYCIVSIVVPCYNEEQSLYLFFSKISSICESINAKNAINFELIFINDGSRDKTLEILKKLESSNNLEYLQIRILNFSRNFGKESAILAGLEHSSGAATILIDADLQDPIEFIPQMISLWLDSKIKIIYARRTNRVGEGKIRAFFSNLFYKLNNFLSSVNLSSGVRDYRLMDRQVVDSIVAMGEYHRFSKALFAWVGFSTKCLEYEYIPQVKDASSWSFKKLFFYGLEGIISFSAMPLRIAFVIGFLMSFLAILLGGIQVIDTLVFGNPVAGYTTIISLICLIGGIELIVLGVIGEYIARIYEQSKKRPHYILDD